MECGIYQIKNNVSGSRYIGQSVTLGRRRADHFYALSYGTHPNIHLQRAYNKYGKESFSYSVLLYCDSNSLTLYEQLCVDGLHPEYNIRRECVDSNLGVKHTEETKIQMSNKKLGHTTSDETRKKISETKTGKTFAPLSEEHKKKISQAKQGQGHPSTEETNRKISETKRMKRLLLSE